MHKLLISMVLAATVAACGSSSSSPSSSSASSPSSAGSSSSAAAPASAASSSQAKAVSGHASVTISMYAYQPARLVVTPGTKVTFTNHDQTAHTATDTAMPGFNTGTVTPGASVTVTLRKPGTYPYVCEFHAFMHGTIVVQ